MKIKDGFVLREVAGNNIVVAIGEESVNFDKMINVNDTGADLWKILEGGVSSIEEVADKMKKIYSIDDDAELMSDISEFVGNLSEAGILE